MTMVTAMAAGSLPGAVLAVAIGLVMGSVLPADLLARARGLDIGTVGDGNPGTVNAFRGMGVAAGSITAAYDVLVGVLAIQIAFWLGASQGVAYLAGSATVVGHRFPVFRRFRGGGQGMAASAGLLLYGVGVAVSRGWLSPLMMVALLAIAAVTFAVTRSDRMIAVVLLPIVVMRVVVSDADWQLTALITAAATYIWLVQVAEVRRRVSRPAGPETPNARARA